LQASAQQLGNELKIQITQESAAANEEIKKQTAAADSALELLRGETKAANKKVAEDADASTAAATGKAEEIIQGLATDLHTQARETVENNNKRTSDLIVELAKLKSKLENRFSKQRGSLYLEPFSRDRTKLPDRRIYGYGLSGDWSQSPRESRYGSRMKHNNIA
jgi:hypothetical protein